MEQPAPDGTPPAPRPPPAPPLPPAHPEAPALTPPGPAPRAGTAHGTGWRRAVWLLVPAAVILWLARGVLGPFVVAAAIAYAFTPLVDSVAERTGARRPIVVIVGFALAVLLMAAGVALIARPLADEVRLLTSQGPDAIALLLRQLIGRDSIEVGGTELRIVDLAAQIQGTIADVFRTPGEAIHMAAEVGNLALETLLALIVTFYMLLDGYRFRDFAIRLFPPDDRARVADLGSRIHGVLGRWLRGQLLLIVLVSAVTYLIMGPILHVPYSLVLALLTGVLEVLPLIGPLIATAIAAVVAFASGGAGLAITVIVIYLVIRQVEDQIVMPVVIGRAVHLHPIVTIFAVLVGLHAFGIMGGLLAVPAAAALNVIFRTLEGLDDHAGEPATDPGKPATDPGKPTGRAAVPG